MWVVDRVVGGRRALARRIAAVTGAALGRAHMGASTHICEHGLVNRPLGESRLGEGFLAAVVMLAVTGVAAARMARPPRARPSAPAAQPARGRADAL